MDHPQKYKKKFSLLFETLTRPGVEIDDYYADRLIHLLNTDEANCLVASPFLSDLLLTTLLKLEQCSLPVQAFLVRFTSVIVNNELQFTKILFLSGLKTLRSVADISDPRLPPRVRCAFVELADRLTRHTSGLIWLHDSDTWKHVFNMCYQKQTAYVKRHAYEFLRNLLWRSSDLEDEDRLVALLDYILKPILTSPYHTAHEVSSEDELSWIALLDPTLEVLMGALLECDQVSRPSVLVQLLTKHFAVDYNLFNIQSISRNAEFNVRLAKLLILIYFAKLLHTKPTNRTDDDFMDQIMLYFNIVNNLIQKRMIEGVLDFVTCSFRIWVKVGIDNSPTSFIRYGRTFETQNQIIALPLVPVLHYVFARIPTWSDGIPSGDIWENFIDGFREDLFTWNCEYSIRACYSFRNLIDEENDPKRYVIESLKRLFTFKSHLMPRQVGTVFRALFYLLNSFLGKELDSDNSIPLSIKPLMPEDVQILTLTIEVIHMLLKQYEIEWHESFELTCLYNKITNILKAHVMPSKFVVRSLDVITLAMKKFLHPNLALLSDPRDMSALDEVGELIFVYLHDGRWEVQDSAAHLLLECTHIAHNKYTPMQKLILTNKLIPAVANLAFSETEFYVQASSVRCLAAMTKIHILWETLLGLYPDIYQLLLSMSQNSREALVRKETVTIWRDILAEGHKLPAEIQSDLYCIMSSSALDDLHWEVQLAALSFWRKVIDNRLTHYGMIDGSFPPVTFSKEHRKIVQLNECVIQKCLEKILQELAVMGCLKVLYENLADDVHVDVLETSVNISKDIMKILSQYNVSACSETDYVHSSKHTAITKVKCSISSPSQSQNIDSPEDGYHSDMFIDSILAMDNIKPQQTDINHSSSVIDSIIGVDDVELLTEQCERQLDIRDVEKCSHNHYVSPNVFINALLTTDYEQILTSKKKWNAGTISLHSLLDEMLHFNPVKNVNEAGCCG